MQLQRPISANAINMSKKVSRATHKKAGKVTKGKSTSIIKAYDGGKDIHGKLAEIEATEPAVGVWGAAIETRLSSFHFLPVLEDDSPTYAYSQIKPLLSFLGYNQEDSSILLEANASTLSRWKNSETPVDIGKLRSKVILDIDEIIAKGVRVFGSEALFQEWLNTSNYALGDVKPVDLLKDVYSIELVEDAIDAISWGSYV